jgi:hypothetical protein
LGKSAQDTPGNAIKAHIAVMAAVTSLLFVLNMFVSFVGVMINRFAICAASVLSVFV